MIRVPLYRRGVVVAHALIDDEDAGLVLSRRWRLKAPGYAAHDRRAGGRIVTTLMHRLILGLVPGDGLEGDHKNGDTLDCRRSNLRVVTKSGNGQSFRRRSGVSRFRNVSRHGHGLWQVKLQVGGRQFHGGYFPRGEAGELAAALRAEEMRRELMPFAVPDPELEQARRLVA